MKEDFELQQVSLRTSRKHSLCLSAFVAKIGHEGTKTQRKLFRKGYLDSTVLYRIRWSGRAGGFCCTTTEKIRATNDTNYHEISFVSALIATKGKVSKQRFAFVVQN